ncbi:hypothetical protein [Sorangium sp. So ce1335]|uniref:hypothetical protein n=1 Tax=Sorangium sp. So ce1335 TaxID=3133335 RepID=UPI003F5E2B42
MPDAQERLTLATCAFVAGCILLAPREWVSAGLALTLAAALFAWHLRLRSKASPKSSAAGPAGAPRSSGERSSGEAVERSPNEAGEAVERSPNEAGERSSGEAVERSPNEAGAQPRPGDERRESA